MKHDISFYHRGGTSRGSRLEPLAKTITVRPRDKRPIPQLSFACDAVFLEEERRLRQERRRLALEEEAREREEPS